LTQKKQKVKAAYFFFCNLGLRSLYLIQFLTVLFFSLDGKETKGQDCMLCATPRGVSAKENETRFAQTAFSF
jgi:hypothetical protein